MLQQIEEGYWQKNRASKVKDVKDTVEGIVELVRKEGDKALIDLTEKFDKIKLKSVMVSRDEIDEAYEKVDPVLVEELENAAYNIQRFHQMQLPQDLWLSEVEPGITLGVKSTPLERVGCYIPGGRAAYPSTALMTVIPARVAGVEEVICCSPAPIAPAILVAMDIAGADEIYSVGGAQAIAAMALGTESIEPVQKIVGPGNVFVTSAKMMLRDVVEIAFDMPVVAHKLDHAVAFTRGPVLLARDSRFADGDLTEPFRRGLKDGQEMPSFAAVRSPTDDMWMAFSATLPVGSHHENPEGALPTTVFFCDYASAGNEWRRDNFYRTWFPVEYGPAE